MKSIYFENIESLVCDIADKFDSLTDEFVDVSVIAKYDEMKEIIRELICMGYDIASLEIHKEEFEEYWDEYILSITKESGTPVIWCEKFKRENGYITEDSSITYVMDNCSSKVIPNVKSKIQFEVSLNDDNECNCGDCDCKYTESSKDDNGETHGFTQSWTGDNGSYYSRSFYSSDTDLVKEMLKNW